MFEIGFSELVVIMVVALVVIGPERLPKVARTMGHLWGRAQRYVNGVKSDIERDMQLEELRQIKLKMQMEAISVERSASQILQAVDRHVSALEVPEPPPVVTQPTQPRSVPVADSASKATTTPAQQQFPID